MVGKSYKRGGMIFLNVEGSFVDVSKKEVVGGCFPWLSPHVRVTACDPDLAGKEKGSFIPCFFYFDIQLDIQLIGGQTMQCNIYRLQILINSYLITVFGYLQHSQHKNYKNNRAYSNVYPVPGPEIGTRLLHFCRRTRGYRRAASSPALISFWTTVSPIACCATRPSGSTSTRGAIYRSSWSNGNHYCPPATYNSCRAGCGT